VSGEQPTTTVSIALRVNGREHHLTVPARRLLVHLIREDLRLTGTKVGCDTTSCGACTILLDGRAVKSCTMFAGQADGADVETVEGLGEGKTLGPLQEAFWAEHGLQCGYCTAGMLMTAAGLLRQEPHPDTAAIRRAISGNLCRCTGYQAIVAAIQRAAEAGSA
jgi:aerobic carbon-monoxide dehydrogenase small subunit